MEKELTTPTVIMISKLLILVMFNIRLMEGLVVYLSIAKQNYERAAILRRVVRFIGYSQGKWL